MNSMQTHTTAETESASHPTQPASGWIEVFRVALKLGLTSFGGPVAHLGYFREEYVVQRRWLDEATYADLVALCQFLPGPASSQVGIAVGLLRAGYAGAMAAWVGFTLPSAIALALFAYGVNAIGDVGGSGWLHGLKVVAVAVVAQAVLGMMRSLAPDRERASLAVAAAVIALVVPSTLGQVGAIVLGGVLGLALLPKLALNTSIAHLPVAVGRVVGATLLTCFFSLLAGLPWVAANLQIHSIQLVDAFYRAGSLVFGGGHVVLPLLQASVVPRGWVTNDAFLAGYGAAQAVPGPLFTFAAYLGAVMGPQPNGWAGAAMCLVSIFLPSFLLVIGMLPFWDTLRRRAWVQSALRGVNAAVVGVLLAALYNPVWKAGITGPYDFALATTAFLLLFMWRTPPWLVVAFGAAVGALIGSL
jgi:chromate transporter